jgi:hypothetical protein
MDSPALNAGEPGPCTNIDGDPFALDQRSVSRPQGAHCDIGAFEFEFPYSLYLPQIMR